jgi:hypothetical protein
MYIPIITNSPWATDVLALLPGAGYELIEGHRCASTTGFVEPFNFAAVGARQTNFTRRRTRSSNPVPSSGESGANLSRAGARVGCRMGGGIIL